MSGAIVLTTLVVAGCAPAAGDGSACERALSPAYPEMEAVAHEMMVGVTGRWIRRATCDAAGRPMAVVAVQVYGWTRRHQARHHLNGAGVRGAGTDLSTPDDAYEVWFIGVTDHRINNGLRFVDVTFTDRSPHSAGAVNCGDCSD